MKKCLLALTEIDDEVWSRMIYLVRRLDRILNHTAFSKSKANNRNIQRWITGRWWWRSCLVDDSFYWKSPRNPLSYKHCGSWCSRPASKKTQCVVNYHTSSLELSSHLSKLAFRFALVDKYALDFVVGSPSKSQISAQLYHPAQPFMQMMHRKGSPTALLNP